MVATADNSATLKALVSVANSKIEPKLVDDKNFTVLSVKPLRSTTSKHNTVADIRIDLSSDSPIAIVASDRYSHRRVEFTRIDLRDIAEFRGIEKNAKGQYVGDITDVASAIALLDAAILEEELVLVKTATATVVKAVEGSLGYIGAITFAGVSQTEEPGEEELEPVVLTALMIVGPETMIAETQTTFSVQPTPANAEAPNLVWSATAGLIDQDGVFVAPAEAGEVIITVTSGTITTDHSVAVLGKAG